MISNVFTLYKYFSLLQPTVARARSLFIQHRLWNQQWP